LIAISGIFPAMAQWPQWGGPNRDFTNDSTGLADEWPEGGPRKLWSREIGSGHSSIVVDSGACYTMCRRGEQDAVLAISADTGETIWETRYDAPTKPGMALDYGPGPHSTPLIAGNRIFTVGAMVQFHCLNQKTGEILWSHDLEKEMGASVLLRGYGASPIAYNDTVILNAGPPRGKPGVGLAAFKQDTGEVVWKNESLGPGYSSPILVRFNDEDHLIVALGADRAGLDPATGEVRWRTQVDFQSYGIMATPLWIEPDCLFCSTGYGGGTRLFRINVKDGEYVPEELWHYRKMQIVHGTMARIGDFVYGSSHGSFGPAFLIAIDLKTGKPAWRKRGFAKANVLHADGKLVILDEEGTLALATATPQGLDVRSRANLLERLSWTVPTLVGTRLYLRDNRTIMALDLSAVGNE
jgi:outer membrane protein assembly factor BamB